MSFSTQKLKNSLSSISTIVEWKNNVTRLNAENLNNLSNGVSVIRDSLSIFGEDVSMQFKVLEDKINNGGGTGGNGDYVSYLQGKVLNATQQIYARENIGALAANAVVDSLVTSDNQFLPYNVPNGIAINDFATKYLIRCDVEQPELTPEEKEQARKNIGASAAEIYVKTPEEEEAIPAYELHVDLTADAAATTSEITEESKNELPTCEAVKNYVANIINITNDGNGNITLNTSGKKVEFSDDGNGNIQIRTI